MKSHRRAFLRTVLNGVPLSATSVLADSPATAPRAISTEGNVIFHGAVGDGKADDTAAIQHAIDAAPSGNRSIVFPQGTYLVTRPLLIRSDRTHLSGAGKYATEILFRPMSPGPCLQFKKANDGVLYQCSLRELAIFSDDPKYRKTAVEIVDGSSFSMQHVAIRGSVVSGRASYWSGDGSIGLRIRGRETAVFSSLDIAADRPIVISDNPNSSIDIDHHSFRDLHLSANRNPVIEIDSGINLTNVSFEGYQAWVGGTHGLLWDDRDASISSNNLSIRGVRWEQGSDPNAYLLKIRHNHGLYMLAVRDCYGGTERNGFYLRGCKGALLENVAYIGTSKEAINIDSSVSDLRAIGCFWETGSSASLGGHQIICGLGSPAGKRPLPSDFYSSARVPQDVTLLGGLGSRPINLSPRGMAALGFNAIGYVFLCDSRQTSAVFQLKGALAGVVKVLGESGAYSDSQGEAGSINVFWSASHHAYMVENATGSQVLIRYALLGTASSSLLKP